MSQVIALGRTAAFHVQQSELLRPAVVLSCALALIFAKDALPF